MNLACVEANPPSPATPGKETHLMPSNGPETDKPLTTEAAPSQCECGQAQAEPPHAIEPCGCEIPKSIGQIAYEAYFKFSEGKSLVSGALLPEWSATQPIIQRAWEAASAAVAGSTRMTLNPDRFDGIPGDKTARVQLDEILQFIKGFPNSRERSLAITKLQESIMWLGMDLKRLGAPNPYPHSYDPSSPVVEPTADGLKL